MNNLINVIKIIYALRINAGISIKRDVSDFLADKIIQACAESTLLAAIEKFFRERGNIRR